MLPGTSHSPVRLASSPSRVVSGPGMVVAASSIQPARSRSGLLAAERNSSGSTTMSACSKSSRTLSVAWAKRSQVASRSCSTGEDCSAATVRTPTGAFLSLKSIQGIPGRRCACQVPSAFMPRPKDQTRRRGELVAATIDVIARKGLGAVQLRDVAEAAGMTSGNVLYYYEGLDELFFAAYERAIERFCVEREAAVEAAGEPVAQLATALRLGVPSGPEDTEIRLLYEFEALAFRSPACAELMAAYVERQVDMYEGILG